MYGWNTTTLVSMLAMPWNQANAAISGLLCQVYVASVGLFWP